MKKQIYYILSFFFIQGLIHNLGHPVTPAMVTNMGIPNYMFGVFFSAMSFGLLVGAPIWGSLGDQGNKKKYIMIGLFIYSIGQFMFAYIGNVSLMVVFRFMSGFNVVASSTLLLSQLIALSSKDDRTKYIAWSAAAMSLGASFGYLIGGEFGSNSLLIDLFGTNDYRRVFLIQALANLGYILYIFLTLKDDIVVKSIEKKPSLLQGFKDIRKLNMTLIIFLIALTLISIGTINVSKFIEVYMNEVGLSSLIIGRFVWITGIVTLGTSIFIVPLIVKIKRDMNIMIYIQVISAIIIFVVFRNEEILILLYSVFMIYVIAKAIFTPLEQNYISSHAVDGKYGTLMGVRQSFFAIGLVIGPLIGGFLYDIQPQFVFDFSVLMFVIGFFLLLAVKGRITKELELKTRQN
ncbi:MAG: MFS transporter [Bacilli bacterium]|nr:MFS transporter [Bacilli bacterium]